MKDIHDCIREIISLTFVYLVVYPVYLVWDNTERIKTKIQLRRIERKIKKR